MKNNIFGMVIFVMFLFLAAQPVYADQGECTNRTPSIGSGWDRQGGILTVDWECLHGEQNSRRRGQIFDFGGRYGCTNIEQLDRLLSSLNRDDGYSYYYSEELEELSPNFCTSIDGSRYEILEFDGEYMRVMLFNRPSDSLQIIWAKKSDSNLFN